MSDHVFRNKKIMQVLEYREAIRKHFPNGKDGYIAEDLDLVLRKHGNKYNKDAVGCFCLVEIKHGRCDVIDGVQDQIGFSKEMTFGLMDRLLKKADPKMERYQGFYVIRTFGAPEWDNPKTIFSVNGEIMDRDAFFSWLNGDSTIDPYQFPFSKYALERNLT